MPNSDVTINAGASVIPTYSISTGVGAGSGSCNASQISGIRQGTSIRVIAYSNSGYYLDRVEVSGVGTYYDSSFYFTMPAFNVTITAYYLAYGTQWVNVTYTVRNYTANNQVTMRINGHSFGTANGTTATVRLQSGQTYEIAALNRYENDDAEIHVDTPANCSSFYASFSAYLGTTDAITRRQFYARQGIGSTTATVTIDIGG